MLHAKTADSETGFPFPRLLAHIFELSARGFHLPRCGGSAPPPLRGPERSQRSCYLLVPSTAISFTASTDDQICFSIGTLLRLLSFCQSVAVPVGVLGRALLSFAILLPSLHNQGYVPGMSPSPVPIAIVHHLNLSSVRIYGAVISCGLCSYMAPGPLRKLFSQASSSVLSEPSTIASSWLSSPTSTHVVHSHDTSFRLGPMKTASPSVSTASGSERTISNLFSGFPNVLTISKCLGGLLYSAHFKPIVTVL